MTQFNKVHFSSTSGEWTTPRALFQALDSEFNFTLDAAATRGNALCPTYFTQEDDALSVCWTGRVWCNPPYGRGLYQWIAHAADNVLSAENWADLVVMLLPARTDTKWFHELVIPYASEVRYIKGRLKFGGSKNSAPFPSMLVIFKNLHVSF